MTMARRDCGLPAASHAFTLRRPSITYCSPLNDSTTIGSQSRCGDESFLSKIVKRRNDSRSKISSRIVQFVSSNEIPPDVRVHLKLDTGMGRWGLSELTAPTFEVVGLMIHLATAALVNAVWDLYAKAQGKPLWKLLVDMTPEELEEGYAWCYRRLFTFGSIWRRRPRRFPEVGGYLGMSLLYKRANWLWPFLIRFGLTGPVWRPLVELARQRHLRFRKRLADDSLTEIETAPRLAAPMLTGLV